ncbi:MAG TPA: enoyl-CoA hydratase [Candidatus Angelobacter sp.]|nr:enoyl-CoA hydratase [Candidatus Angelobacter sp.]
MAENVVTIAKDRILTIRMNRPEKKNALTRAMYIAMTEAILQAEQDPAVRVILLAGADNCFTAGNDIADFAAASPGEAPVAIDYLRALAAVEKPVVAAVAGFAIGIGTTMLLHCDLVYAAETARFQLPFVNLGLCPEAGSSVILPAMMGHHRAAELLLLGEPFGVDLARELGLVNRVFDPHELMSAAVERSHQLAEKPPVSLRSTKMLLKSGTKEAIAAALDRETGQFAALLQGPEAKEAMSAFLERRKPDFSKF